MGIAWCSRFHLALVSLLVVNSVLHSTLSAAADRDALEFFETFCSSCHDNGAREGGLDRISDLNSLVARRYIVPGNPDASPIFRRVKQREMPTRQAFDFPVDADITKLRRWISELSVGAPVRDFVSDGDLLDDALAFLGRQGIADRPFYRFLSLVTMYNSGVSETSLASYRTATSQLLNSLSWKQELAPVEITGQHEALLAIDLRKIGWPVANWDTIASLNPYPLNGRLQQRAELQRVTRSTQAIIRADWFVQVASKPPLYYDLLKLPATLGGLERMLGVDTYTNVRNTTASRRFAARAGFASSGVSRSNRVIEHHATQFGSYWKSFDFSGSEGVRNIFDNPLGPESADLSRNNAFKHDGGEMIFSLPNGLQAYFVTNAAEQRLDEAPTAIVFDPSRSPGTIIAGFSCMGCHSNGLLEKSDTVAATVSDPDSGFGASDRVRVNSLYPDRSVLASLFADGTRRHQSALNELNRFSDEGTILIQRLADEFERDVTADRAAAELGLRANEFSDALSVLPFDLARPLLPLRSGASIKRSTFQSLFFRVAERIRETGLPPSGSIVLSPGIYFDPQQYDGRHFTKTPPYFVRSEGINSDIFLLTACIKNGSLQTTARKRATCRAGGCVVVDNEGVSGRPSFSINSPTRFSRVELDAVPPLLFSYDFVQDSLPEVDLEDVRDCDAYAAEVRGSCTDFDYEYKVYMLRSMADMVSGHCMRCFSDSGTRKAHWIPIWCSRQTNSCSGFTGDMSTVYCPWN